LRNDFVVQQAISIDRVRQEKTLIVKKLSLLVDSENENGKASTSDERTKENAAVLLQSDTKLPSTAVGSTLLP
jgi:hypothetical protein